MTGGQAAASRDVPIGRRLIEIPEEGSLRATSSEREGFIADLSEQRRLSSQSALCDASVASSCKTCIETEDPWCQGNSWDQFCSSGCDGPTQYMVRGCKNECAEPKVVTVTAKKTKEVDNVVSVLGEARAAGEMFSNSAAPLSLYRRRSTASFLPLGPTLDRAPSSPEAISATRSRLRIS